MIYFNENDPYCAQWLCNLIEAGHLPKGSHVDQRSIADVTAGDLHGYARCHFFAGIGAWELALQYAGWPSRGVLNPSGTVWTGSCPCQPFSQAGKGEAEADHRHLWPEFFRLIRECRPDVVFGEQVDGPLARAWLDHVRHDVESVSYAFGAAGLPVASVGAPHGRPRLWWVADAYPQRFAAQTEPRDSNHQHNAQPRGSVGNASAEGLPLRERESMGGAGRRQEGRAAVQSGGARLALADAREEQRGQIAAHAAGRGRRSKAEELEQRPLSGLLGTWGFWADAEWIPCRDEKARPTEPGTSPVAYGSTNRVGQLRAYGNAICPQLAAEFAKAYLEC